MPEQYGGSGWDALSTAIALEAFGYGCHDGGLVFSLCAHILSCVVPLWQHGNEEQRQRYLPGLCNGKLIGVHAMTEPGSGSDAFALRTKAEPDGAGFRINGTKTFISNGPVADLVIVFAMTDPKKGYYGGVTAFLVQRTAPGFTASRKFEKMGLRTSPIGELVFEDVYVPAEAVLGAVGAGSALFTTPWTGSGSACSPVTSARWSACWNSRSLMPARARNSGRQSASFRLSPTASST